jgi:UDP-N-acetylmuramoylalanine--D-glutamate ligase
MNLIVGFGKTGISLAEYFLKKNIPFEVLEERAVCENLELFKHIKIFHQMTESQLQSYETVYLSPGVNPHTPFYSSVKAKLSNDLNLFTLNCNKPYMAVTGSNGKSTLVHLLEAALRGAGKRAIAIGNNGVTMLDHLDDDVDYFILELSSYQLELAKPFVCEVAYVSNISQDHLDRHGTIEHYAAIKESLYQNCRYAVVNIEDEFCKEMRVTAEKIAKIALSDANMLPPLKMIGQHNVHNALAAIAMLSFLNINMKLAVDAIAAFPGLEHRCEFVLEKNDVTWWNDSKGTNVASTMTAINSLNGIIKGKLIIILGGQGKGQDFSELVTRLKNKTRAVILLGECKRELEQLFRKEWVAACSLVLAPSLDCAGMTPSEAIVVVETLQQSIEIAKKLVQPGDAVLLSPACASLDMFKNYEDRGRQFKDIVIKNCD